MPIIVETLGDGGAVGSTRPPTGRTRWSKTTGTLVSKLCMMVGKPGTYSNATIVELSRTGGAKSYTVFHRSASKIEAYIEDEDFSEQNSIGRLRGFRGAAMVECICGAFQTKAPRHIESELPTARRIFDLYGF